MSSFYHSVSFVAAVFWKMCIRIQQAKTKVHLYHGTIFANFRQCFFYGFAMVVFADVVKGRSGGLNGAMLVFADNG